MLRDIVTLLSSRVEMSHEDILHVTFSLADDTIILPRNIGQQSAGTAGPHPMQTYCGVLYTVRSHEHDVITM